MSFAPSTADSRTASAERSDSYVSFAASAAAFERAPVTRPGAVRGEIAIELELRHAGRRSLRLRYEIQGDRALPALFVAGGISAHRHLAPSREFGEGGWWENQVGAGRSLDPARHCLVSFDWLGADGTLDFAIDPADQADAVAALLDALRIERLQAFVGYSYGAMVGLQFAARHPQRLDALVSISGTHRAHPYAAAWRALQRRAVALGALQCDEAQGLALARELAVLSYRTRKNSPSASAPRRWSMAACASTPRTTSTIAATSTSPAPRRPRSCACPNPSTCSSSTRPRCACRSPWSRSAKTG